ncbi:MAG: hypothetical protein CBC46_07005 [Verrucomicrobiaceae bacterium TMED86]|nr:MAG: hypothetical protein CBC46_07005 [Verrucomicrobiaceae bacterium TMED86]
MNRPWVIWLVLCGCATVILGMFSWMTVHALSSEKERIEMESQSQISERMRLSLARMDTVGTGLLVVENQRPPFHYEAFYFPENVMTNTLQSVEKGVILQPSPLLLEERDLVKMHFEVTPSGEFRSPQMPVGSQREMAIQSGANEAALNLAGANLEKVKMMLPENLGLAAKLCIAAESSPWGTSEPLQAKQQEANAWMSRNANDVIRQQSPDQKIYQDSLNTREKQSRAGVLKKAVGKAAKRSSEEAQSAYNYSNRLPVEQIVKVAPLLPVWVGEELFLIREVQMSRSTKYQGVWLDREKVEAEFLAQIPRDLVGAKMMAVKGGMEQVKDPFVLASLPWKLVQGPLAEGTLDSLTPLRSTLIAGWVAALLALVALYLLLKGVMKLSERRAAFVSSVTHELRTPLTTFRLYSEMLAEGMITDEVKREEYLRTMLSESERLNHLVENVLAYSRIEKGNARSKSEVISVENLVGQLRPILQRRVDQESAALSIEIAEDAGEIDTDVTAIEQILFNLIDNACKYGLPDAGRGHVTLRAFRSKRGVEFEVSDRGRGVAARERKRLFRAFHKSALDAAHDKPGVGLGLALCRRLARALGGDLILDPRVENGASFRLLVPVS